MFFQLTSRICFSNYNFRLVNGKEFIQARTYMIVVCATDPLFVEIVCSVNRKNAIAKAVSTLAKAGVRCIGLLDNLLWG